METGKYSTKVLLKSLDNEIDRKCRELQQKNTEAKLKRAFLGGCIVIFIGLLMQVIFKVFNVNSLLFIFVFQVLALLFVLPIVMNLNERFS